MEFKITSNLAVPIVAVLLLISSVIGYIVGYSQGKQNITGASVSDMGYEALAFAPVQSVSAGVSGTVSNTDGSNIVVEDNGEYFTLEVPENYNELSLTVISPLTEEDQTAWDKYQTELETYNKAVQEYYGTADDAEVMLPVEEGTDVPRPPVAPFSMYGSEMLMPGEESETEATSAKTESSMVAVSDLQTGDSIQAELRYYQPEGGASATSGKQMQISQITVTRDLR